ncbi:NrsF family protein [Methylobacterium sp.]|uniref:NrsF family protein n=1 Tax=Methylobacterium sp. TaxID=409 RepID=UPI003B012E23
MKTDELIGLLGNSFEREPAGTPWMTRQLALAVAVGATVALCLALAFLGLRPGLTQARPLLFLALKVAFAVAVGGLALRYLARAARPGGESRVHLGVVALPFLAVAALAGVSLSMTPPEHWHGQISGHTWLECLVSIPVIAIVPFAVVMWAVRRFGAPTDLVRAGALVGLSAGAVSALGYSLHCMDDTVPFVAVWYGGTIAICTLVGAFLGPRLLRW